MKLNNIIKNFKFDKRLIEWNLNNEIISVDEYEKYLQSLLDLSDKKEEISSLTNK